MLPLNLLKPSFGLCAYRADPRFRAVFQFRMILVLPGARSFPKRRALPSALDLLASDLRQKRTPPPFTDQFVNVGNHVQGENDMRFLRHTPSVT